MKILKHGKQHKFGTTKPYCPECRSDRVWHKEEWNTYPPCGEHFKCAECGCEFVPEVSATLSTAEQLYGRKNDVAAE